MKLTPSNTLLSASIATALVSQLTAQTAEEELVELATSTVIGEASSIGLNPITSFKTGTALIDIPQSASIVTAEEFTSQGLESIGEIVDYTPGVNNSQGEGHRDAVVFRGVRSTADFFVDGVRDDVQYYRPLYNVEQVEFLRGPNALFFGRGGTGGVINRVYKKPIFDEEFTDYTAKVNSFGGFTQEFDYNTSVTDRVAFRLNVAYDKLENHRDFFYGDQLGFNPSLTYKFNDDTSIRFSFEHINHERFIDRGIPTGDNGKPVRALDGIVFGDRNLNFSTLDANIATITLDHQFNDNWKGSVTASYGKYDKLYQNFYASDYDQSTDIVTIDGYRDTTERDRFQLSGDLVGEFSTGSIDHKLVLGSEFIHTSNDNDRYNANFSPDENSDSDTEQFFASNFSLSNGVGTNINGTTVVNDFNTSLADDTQATVNVYSFFIQDEIAVTSWFDVILGARFDSFDIDVNGTSTGSETDNNISPRLGFVAKPNERLSLYASYSETFLPSSGNQFANAGDRFDPDTFESLEAGLKWDVKDNLFLTLAAFKTDQSFTTDLDGDGRQDRQESEVSGFEAQLKGNITDQWFITTGYTYLDSKTPSGDTTRDTPEHAFSIWNKYQVNDKLDLGLGLTYQDESLTGNGSSSRLPSYVRVDAGASYQLNQDCKLSLHIENLFDTNYSPTSHSTHQTTVGAPINATFAVKYRF